MVKNAAAKSEALWAKSKPATRATETGTAIPKDRANNICCKEEKNNGAGGGVCSAEYNNTFFVFKDFAFSSAI